MSNLLFKEGPLLFLFISYLYFAGRFVLTKKIIIVNTYTHRCSNRDSNVCLHYQAFNECSQNACAQVCNRYVNDEVVYYSPNSKNIFSISIFYSRQRREKNNSSALARKIN